MHVDMQAAQYVFANADKIAFDFTYSKANL